MRECDMTRMINELNHYYIFGQYNCVSLLENTFTFYMDYLRWLKRFFAVGTTFPEIVK